MATVSTTNSLGFSVTHSTDCWLYEIISRFYASFHPWYFVFSQWGSQGFARLLHSLVALGLSMGYETWLSVGWHHAFVIVWYGYRLGLPQSQWVVGSCNWWEFLSFSEAIDSPLCLPLGLCKETVKESQGLAGLSFRVGSHKPLRAVSWVISFNALRPEQNGHQSLQVTFSNTFCWVKVFVFWLRFHGRLFPKAQLTISQHWFR